jgi:Fe2+ or Zn2+ uptake regulation protein
MSQFGSDMADSLTSLQQQVLDYLRQHVHAAETAEGVTRVWLQRTPAASLLAEVEQALDGLTQRGLIEKHVLPGGTAVYRASRRH